MDNFSPSNAQLYYDELSKVRKEYSEYKLYSSNIEEIYESEIHDKDL